MAVSIALLPPSAAEDTALVAGVADLVNGVYRVAEGDLWLDGAVRTDADDVRAAITVGELAAAQEGGTIVGVVRVQRLAHDLGGFGMLAAGPERRGEGIGRDLVAFAEARARDRGATEMQLELLVPRGRPHPGKEQLHEWYSRLGYRPVRAGRLEDAYPHLGPLLAVECDLVEYRKPLAG